MAVTSRDRILRALKLEIPDRVPFCELAVDLGVASKIWSKNNISQKEISKLLHRDNLTIWCNAPTYSKKKKGKDGREFEIDGLIKTNKDLSLIKLPDISGKRFFQPYIQFVDEKEGFAACAVMSCGIDSTIMSMGLEGFCIALYENRSLVNKVLDIYTEWYASVIPRLIQIGFDIIWIGDDIAYKTGPFFSREIFQELLFPRIGKVIDAITVPWIFHSDGNLLPIFDDLLNLGMSAIHPIEPEAMDIVEIKRKYQGKVCLVGNVSIDTLGRGTPENTEMEVKSLMDKVAPGGGYMISSANVIPSYAKPENVVAMARAIEKYGSYRD